MGTVSLQTKKKPVLKVGNIEYSLPTQRSVPVENLGGYTMLIYGRKKIGKTSLCKEFPGSLFLFFEPGGKALRLFQRQVTSWLAFKRYIDLIVKDSTFKTIIIDVADYAYDMCSAYVCKDLGVDHPSDAGWGKGWNAVKKEFNGEILRLLRCGKGVIFISHQREEEIEERSGRKYHRKTNTLSGQAREALEGLVDIWANYDYEEKKRVLTILGDDFTDAGHRLEEKFKYTNGNPIREISMGKSSQEGYKNFLDGFNNKLIEPVKEAKAINKQVLPVKKSIK